MGNSEEMVTIQLTKDEAAWASARIEEMNEMYGDPDRSDWFDADDIAHDVADYFGAKLDDALEHLEVRDER